MTSGGLASSTPRASTSWPIGSTHRRTCRGSRLTCTEPRPWSRTCASVITTRIRCFRTSRRCWWPSGRGAGAPSLTSGSSMATSSSPPSGPWSASRYPVLLDLPLSPAAREQLAGKLLVTHRGHSIDFRLLVYELLVRSLERDDPRTVLSLRPDLCARLLLRQASSAQARSRRSQSPVALPPGDGPSVPSGQAARALGGVSGSLQADVSRGAAARTHGRRARSVRRAMSEFPAALACADQHAQRAQPGAG